ncbi:MAG: hypothetical protein RL040_1468 [Bacteroidota bacterium]
MYSVDLTIPCIVDELGKKGLLINRCCFQTSTQVINLNDAVWTRCSASLHKECEMLRQHHTRHRQRTRHSPVVEEVDMIGGLL